ncbi:MAG: hypothetical protein LBB79_00415 [Prevotellaceae bacterium]|jgi:flavodoxin|nr:hypothetical protein [Prevotellaceae bacterium]
MKTGNFDVMLWAIVIAALAALICVFAVGRACGNPQASAEAEAAVAPPEKVDLGRALIVYYSFSGKTAEVATLIQEATGGTLHRIETTQTYSSLPVIRALEAKGEVEGDKLPELQAPAPDASEYDLILVGSPVWRHTISPPTLSFLEQYDFKGKKVAAFATNKGNVGDFFTLFEQKLRHAQLLQGEEFNNKLSGTPALRSKVEAWLKQLKTL